MSTKTSLMVVSLVLSIVIGVVNSKSGAKSADSSRSPAGGRQLLIGLSLDTLKESRWQADSELFQARCKALGTYVLVRAANSDETRQINDCQSLLTSKVDVRVIVAHDSDAMVAFRARRPDPSEYLRMTRPLNFASTWWVHGLEIITPPAVVVSRQFVSC